MPSGRSFNRTFVLLILVVAVMLVLSSVSLYTATQSYFHGEENATVYLMLSLLGIAISVYMLMAGRSRPIVMFEDQRLNTLLQCEKCNFKSVREFRRGDYIFKKSDECPKCKEKMIITAIYREAKEEEKEWKI